MRFLSVADRELRCAARNTATYRIRWVTAMLFFVLLLWLTWASDGFRNKAMAPQIFAVYSVLVLLYCLALSAARTADSISAEKREGTLGLLFLTNLNSAEILAGKMFCGGLASFYGLLAIFPMLALPFLMGGVTIGHFGRSLLALMAAVLYGTAAGFVASVFSRRQFMAIAVALALSVGLAGGLFLGAMATQSFAPTLQAAKYLALFSPITPLSEAGVTTRFVTNLFWPSLAATIGLSALALVIATAVLSRVWRDRPKSRIRLKWGTLATLGSSTGRISFRRRSLSINPMFWLASRDRVASPLFMCIAVAVTLATIYISAPVFVRLIGTGVKAAPVAGHLIAWIFGGLGLHVTLMYYAAMSASQRLAEDKQTGALELILSTPVNERSISRGLWLAYARKLMFPALFTFLVHVFFVWQCLVMCLLVPPGGSPLPAGTTPSELFWSALSGRPLRGSELESEVRFVVHLALLVLIQCMATWPTLGWLGRWLGLRMKHPGFAPLASVALLIPPPVLVFSFCCIMADKLNLDRMPERKLLPIMMWLGFTIGMTHCAVLSAWAAWRLRTSFRSVVMSRYEPLPKWRWTLPSRRMVWNLTRATAGAVALLALIAVSYFGYQNWRSRSAWQKFVSAAQQRGETLDLAAFLPKAVPDSDNFARSAAFQQFLRNTKLQNTNVFHAIGVMDIPGPFEFTDHLWNWTSHTSAPLPRLAATLNAPTTSKTDRLPAALAILDKLEHHQPLLSDLTAQAATSKYLQFATYPDHRAIMVPPAEALWTERLHLTFGIRACSYLASGRAPEAADDVLHGLRLASLARQLPDVRSNHRVNSMLIRNLQPIWEGLNQRAWNDAQLAAIAQDLQSFPLLADYTNAVRRVTLAYIQAWRKLAENPHTRREGWFLEDVRFVEHPALRLQPRGWWLESCQRLHDVSGKTLNLVDVHNQRMQHASNPSGMLDLPLSPATKELLAQQSWAWAHQPVVSFTQTSVNQAIIACAIERFRLANGAYPNSLQQLVPAFLKDIPHDIITGRPMAYEITPTGAFILRGVGYNGVSDRKSGLGDDWLWQN